MSKARTYLMAFCVAGGKIDTFQLFQNSCGFQKSCGWNLTNYAFFLTFQCDCVVVQFLFLAYFVWGLMFSIQPPFYPKEAEAKGATPSQVDFG